MTATSTLCIEQMPETSRLWVYQANRNLSEQEVGSIATILTEFTADWNTHGMELRGAYDVVYNRFVVIVIDDNFERASGCSIDKSVRLIKQLEQQFNISFFDRMQVCYLEANEIKDFKAHQVKDKLAKGEITVDTLVFNNTVSSKGEWISGWKQKLSDSWVAKFV